MIIENETDLTNLIQNKIQEDTNLDYKIPDFSKPDFNKELVKDVSAMANSDGGLIIYGISEVNHSPDRIIWIERDEGYKERIEQIISSKIFRKIECVKVKKIFSNDKTKFVIVIDIPKSDVAPHQTYPDGKQRRYYKRHGSTTEEMENYEIEDLFFKRKRPILEIELKRNKTVNPSYNINLFNKGKVLGEKVIVQLSVPAVLEISDDKWEKKEEMFFHGAQYKKYVYFQDKYPVFPEIPFLAGIIFHPKNVEVIQLSLSFLITCADMELKKGKITIDRDKIITEYMNEEGIPVPDLWEIKRDWI